MRCLGKDPQFLCPLLSFFNEPWWGERCSAIWSQHEHREGGAERGGHLVLGASYSPAAALTHLPPLHHRPTSLLPPLPLGDALWGSGQFAYILIYKKLSALADSEPGLHAKELNNPVCAQPDLGKGVEEGAAWQHFSFPTAPQRKNGGPRHRASVHVQVRSLPRRAKPPALSQW